MAKSKPVEKLRQLRQEISELKNLHRQEISELRHLLAKRDEHRTQNALDLEETIRKANRLAAEANTLVSHAMQMVERLRKSSE